ncbi:MAG: hypothetical protein FWD55_06205, partial [Propionibacteriaceae bacterium]|nr:hypothetical protein [Propionibacteriaceae bacterium]
MFGISDKRTSSNTNNAGFLRRLTTGLLAAALAAIGIAEVSTGGLVPPANADVSPPGLGATATVSGGYNDTARLLNNRGREGIGHQPLGTYITFELSKPTDRLFFQWQAGANYNYNTYVYGSPRDYTVEVSTNSTNGTNGTWTTVATVINNRTA